MWFQPTEKVTTFSGRCLCKYVQVVPNSLNQFDRISISIHRSIPNSQTLEVHDISAHLSGKPSSGHLSLGVRSFIESRRDQIRAHVPPTNLVARKTPAFFLPSNPLGTDSDPSHAGRVLLEVPESKKCPRPEHRSLGRDRALQSGFAGRSEDSGVNSLP